jgi:DNA-binding YbaB/EbfC family protein
MFGDIINKVKLAQQDHKLRMEQILVDGQAENGQVKVVVNGNKMVKQILISPELFAQGDKEAIEDLLIIALNRAIEKAEAFSNDEMKEMAKGVIPPIPGLTF